MHSHPQLDSLPACYPVYQDAFAGLDSARPDELLHPGELTFPAMNDLAQQNTQSFQQEARRRPKYTRSRTGCWTCRQKKVKCDETKPSCTRCVHTKKLVRCQLYILVFNADNKYYEKVEHVLAANDALPASLVAQSQAERPMKAECLKRSSDTFPVGCSTDTLASVQSFTCPTGLPQPSLPNSTLTQHANAAAITGLSADSAPIRTSSLTPASDAPPPYHHVVPLSHYVFMSGVPSAPPDYGYYGYPLASSWNRPIGHSPTPSSDHESTSFICRRFTPSTSSSSPGSDNESLSHAAVDSVPTVSTAYMDVATSPGTFYSSSSPLGQALGQAYNVHHSSGSIVAPSPYDRSWYDKREVSYPSSFADLSQHQGQSEQGLSSMSSLSHGLVYVPKVCLLKPDVLSD
ncbi:hypothetical protein K488DRAFT_90541 [Vararia minispora EC-137]|uniref:Uncharacterized protein n=1 Tax=Vararia minispora EC-137 TaxID=1314806 RepID=A0ACB8Q7P1_9AGAM|nr:hypothetical protein K488DRAFT_90541 [Vararia minispora EC-137]